MFVPVRILQTHVKDMGAVAGLAPPYFSGFLEGFLGDQPSESSAAQNVGALSYDDRPGVFIDDQRFDPGHPGFAGIHELARRPVRGGLGQ